jgi:hypothetical protein
VRLGSSGVAATLALLVAVSACSRPVASPSERPSGSPGDVSTPASAPSVGPSQAPATRDLAWYALPQADDLFRGAAIASLAGGPAGFVILGNDRATGGLMSWTSSDGDGWVRHWLPGATFEGGTPGWLVGGSFGYLALGWKLDGSSFSRALWSSSDGVNWNLAPVTGLPVGEIASLVSGPLGAAVTFDFAERGSAVATTQDGRSWQVAALPAGAVPRIDGVVALPDGFFVTGSVEGTDAAGAPTSPDSAWRTSDGVSWTADARLGQELAKLPNSIETWALSPWGTVGVGISNEDGVLVTANGLESWPAPPDPSGRLVGGAGGLLWIQGGDRSSSCSAGWQFADGGWRQLQGTRNDRTCLDAASPSVLGSASTANGMVMIGQVGSASESIAWLVRGPGTPPSGSALGGPIAAPPSDAIPDPQAATIDRPASCSSQPASFATFIAVEPRTAVGCFGDKTLSFKAWVVDPGEGYGGTCAAFTPGWIRECVLPDYLLAADAKANAGTQPILHAMRAPNATGATRGVGRWVQVQGHYDDPVSSSCRGAGDFGSVSLEPEVPKALAVLECRLVFVVTDIRTVK